MSELRAFHGPNAGYVLELYERFLHDPDSVPGGWRDFFEHTPPDLDAGAPAAAAPPAGGGAAGAAAVDVEKLVAARELSRTIRVRGHTAARLNPLGFEPEPDPALALEYHGLTESDLERLPAAVVLGHDPRSPNALAEMRRLNAVYSGTVGYDYHHIPNAEERAWLREAIESGRYLDAIDEDRGRHLLRRLTRVEGFEKYLHKTFFGQKRFSIEGNDMLVPMMDEIAAEAARAGLADLVVGMAHRGRLNVLAHVLEKPYEKMLVGFQGAAKASPADATNPDVPSGDVKYHMGWQTVRRFDGREIRLTLSPNPSHLEFVDPVVVGMTRAAQDETDAAGRPTLDVDRAMAILVHGDAAFPGQGVVAETFNMSVLDGYTVGGTVHIIANNQIGFTTNPQQSRSTRYASDLAKGFEVPVVHVNADDAEACMGVARLAQAYRQRFHKDFVIDLVGYRRWGHNEGDEPLFTQPVMYGVIRTHPTAREKLAADLVERGVVSQEEADAMLQEVFDQLSEVQRSLREEPAPTAFQIPRLPDFPGADTRTAVDADTLRELNEGMLRVSEGFTPNPRLAKLVLERRRDALASEEPAIDWGHAEALAFGSLLADGVPVRLTGQDAERGTFSHRHLVLNDAETGRKLDLMASLPQARASFEIYNSPLSEMAVVGFEYGYSVFDPQALVLWEAQFGDFVNGAQVMIDQYLSSSYQKWGQTSGLVLLLPHGYEGQGPEHSSARLERFLQLCAENNMQVVYPTTSAQYFHLLRRQAALLERAARPLVVMSPKSLLRHPLAASRLQDLAEGGFQCVIGDADAATRADQVTRLLLCTGKVYVDLVNSDARADAHNVALARVEELYPFPESDIQGMVESFPALQEVVWVQEEPRNMGAWGYMLRRLGHVLPKELEIRYEGRPNRASPAEGSPDRHKVEQERIVTAAWTGAAEPAKQQRKKRA
jgi:2-oxoglutarate dehydrogenase E1 component